MIRAKTPLILLTAGALALSACNTPANQTGDPNRTQNGALIGALAGGIFGAATNNSSPRRGALVGAAVGAGIGAAIGNSLDQQEAALRNDLGNGNIGIVNTGNELIVTMPQDILFATDSYAVRGDLQRDLGVLADNLRDYPNTTVDVIGHTDNVGDASYNQNLSSRRAAAVAQVLRNNGVSNSRLRSYGRGESEPVATNLNAQGRAQNRRVEIVIRPTS